MTVSSTAVILSLSIGLPLLLLAAGILYHAHVLSRQPATTQDQLSAHVESLATGSSEELLAGLQEMMEQMQGQLTNQRHALERLLSDPVGSPARSAGSPALPSFATSSPQAMAAGQHPHQWPEMPQAQPGDLRGEIRQFADEGLSDRAIARRLGIGLEEVRIVRARGVRS